MINFDSAATAPLDFSVMVDYLYYAKKYPCNPSSVYQGGVDARKALEDARKRIADKINCKPSEIFFTSGGTEGNNMVLQGFPNKEPSVLITTQIEHPSVLHVAEHLDEIYPNLKVYYLPVDRFGEISLGDLDSTIATEIDEGIDPDNILVSIQGINNEIGAIQPLGEIYDIVNRYGVYYHIDGVQYFPHYYVYFDGAFCCDAMTVSAHKFGGLRGTGFVYISERLQKHLCPVFFGGSQESGLRPGTEDVAAAISLANLIERYAFDDPEWDWLLDALDRKNINYRTNSDLFSPIMSITFPGVDASSLISLLSEKGIYLSAGSACHSYISEPSHVLKAIGLSDEDAKSTVRFCHNRKISDEEKQYFLENFIYYINLLKGDTL